MLLFIVTQLLSVFDDNVSRDVRKPVFRVSDLV